MEVRGPPDRYPVHRIYCVGRSYADHAREMGGDPEREHPFSFMKPADAVVPSGTTIPYPSRTANFHHELELVPGDLIYTGTPAGVGALKSGDRIEASIEGLDPLVTVIA